VFTTSLFSLLLNSFFGGGLAALYLFLGVQGATAFGRAAVAQGFAIVAVVEAVVVGEFLAGSDVADGLDPDASANFNNCG